VACSPGSACTAGAGKASPVLEAMGLDAPWTHSAVLFTLGPGSTEAEVDHAGGAFADAVAALRRMSPLTPR
jgi:cysteine sulfinate desulfinase/cysteine desulfurase-like protein